MSARTVSSLQQVPAEQWNALVPAGELFARHEFLAAFERTHCVGPGTGWQPEHLLIESAAGQLEAAVPLYRKAHSWGEFVFDFSWAQAYAQAGLPYYPKLVGMTPFTPATGTRLLAGDGPQATLRSVAASEALLQYLNDERLSSAHLLYVAAGDREALSEQHWLWRKDCQFHWHNRGYADFDSFLATFRADKRKKALRERRRIREAGIEFRTWRGEEMDAPLWEVVFGFSAATFAARGNEHYLNPQFFREVSAALPGSIMVKLAEYRGRPIATAIFFRSTDTLYGRYWGAAADFHSLHFETCYYQGIEYCIEQGLSRFEPGTQGEHKVPRGFAPHATWSAHRIVDRRFHRAIDAYLSRERAAIDEYIEEVRQHVPFRRGPLGGGELSVPDGAESE